MISLKYEQPTDNISIILQTAKRQKTHTDIDENGRSKGKRQMDKDEDKDKDKGQPAKSWIYRRALLRCERARRSSVEWHPAVDDLVVFTKVEDFSKLFEGSGRTSGRPGVFTQV